MSADVDAAYFDPAAHERDYITRQECYDLTVESVRAAIRAEAGTLDDWARWIVRQGRNPQPGCPECGPLGMDQAPSLCVPHQALARLAGADRD